MPTSSFMSAIEMTDKQISPLLFYRGNLLVKQKIMWDVQSCVDRRETTLVPFFLRWWCQPQRAICEVVIKTSCQWWLSQCFQLLRGGRLLFAFNQKFHFTKRHKYSHMLKSLSQGFWDSAPHCNCCVSTWLNIQDTEDTGCCLPF